VLDTETTGLNPKQDQVLSIGAVLVEERSIQLGEVLELTLQNPQASTSSIPIHGILPSESAAGIPPEEASRKLLRFIGNSPLVGHHLAFDLRMLQKLLATHCPGFFFHNRCLDTAQLARRLEKPFVSQDMIRGTDYSLDELIKRYGLVAHDRHTALGDAFITAQLFLKLLSRGGQAGWRRI
jgi:DNA polymerase-3 subunit epsilon